MNTMQRKQEEEPPSRREKVCIGIALAGEDSRVAARTGGREIAHGRFPANPLGTAALRWLRRGPPHLALPWRLAGYLAGRCSWFRGKLLARPRTSPAMRNGPSDGSGPVSLHVCPVCGKTHAVPQARQLVACGRQLTCSCACEHERRRIRKQRFHAYVLRVQDGR
jgi:hypothetical protein